MQMFENLPWYGYIILVVGLGSYVVRYFLKAKEGYVEPDVMNARLNVCDGGRLEEKLTKIVYGFVINF